LDAFQVGDIVNSVVVPTDSFIGSVRFVDHKCNKVLVAWGGGSLSQHDPEEIQLSIHQPDLVKGRMASRRTALVPEQAKDDPQFVGDPKVHGIDKPRGGGFSIMQNLVEDLREEALDEASENPKVTDIHGATTAGLKSRRAGGSRERQKQKWMRAMHEEVQAAVPGVDANLPHDYWDTAAHLFFQGENPRSAAKKLLRSIQASRLSSRRDAGCEKLPEGPMRDNCEKKSKGGDKKDEKKAGLQSRRAMYWCSPERTYRLTRSEQEAGGAGCPKCKAPMDLQKFTRGSKIYLCEECGFKVTTDKTLTESPVVEAVPSPEAVVVEATELRSRRISTNAGSPV
jgi:hypothetical protein